MKELIFTAMFLTAIFLTVTGAAAALASVMLGVWIGYPAGLALMACGGFMLKRAERY